MNRYIKAMEIGLANEKNGISYFDLLEQLEKGLGDKLGEGAEKTFVTWFINNFSSDVNKMSNNHIATNFTYYIKDKYGQDFARDYQPYVDSLKSDLNKKYWLDGTASKQYLDYLELQESRITANNAQTASIEANKKAATSIKLAIGAIFASVLLGVYSIYSSPEPPYDVKIIEDNTRAIELEKVNEGLKKKNDSLSKELFKAEIMVRVLKEGKK